MLVFLTSYQGKQIIVSALWGFSAYWQECHLHAAFLWDISNSLLRVLKSELRRDLRPFHAAAYPSLPVVTIPAAEWSQRSIYPRFSQAHLDVSDHWRWSELRLCRFLWFPFVISSACKWWGSGCSKQLDEKVNLLNDPIFFLSGELHCL